MAHTCEECGETFDTLSRLRLHDCSSDSDSAPVSDESAEPVEPDTDRSTQVESQFTEAEVDALDEALAAVGDGTFDVLVDAIATYETTLAAAEQSEGKYSYRELTRTYEEPLIEALDEATQAEGWPFLEQFLTTYPPEGDGEFPHVTTALQNVTGRYLIRTRLAAGVDAIPPHALEYFAAILDTVKQQQDFINEGVHPYGWGIGHPEHAVADRIHAHASRNIFVVNPMLEHAFYADQHAAMDLLERLLADESIERTIPYRRDKIDEVRYLLDAPAGAASDFSPTIPRYWDWQAELGYTFELATDIEQRIRDIVTEEGLAQDLPSDWEVADLTI